ncbi:MAG: M23 family metallopeptidase, partial [Paracoccaceae bacterium]
MSRRAALAAVFSSLATVCVAGDLRLTMPIDCVLGEGCHIQQYVDQDPGPGAQDYLCETLSYEGHKGTDFALPYLRDIADDVAVLAAAPGVIRATRNTMADRLFTTENETDIAGKECGNGVVIRHDDGWETQYCHMKRGSISVTKGQRIEAGTELGHVGLSGRTQFPHLHFSVRKDGKSIDPFAPSEAFECGAQQATL